MRRIRRAIRGDLRLHRVASFPPSHHDRSHRRATDAPCNVLVLDSGVARDIAPEGAALSSGGEIAKLQLEHPSGEDDPWDDDENALFDPYSGHGTFTRPRSPSSADQRVRQVAAPMRCPAHTGHMRHRVR